MKFARSNLLWLLAGIAIGGASLSMWPTQTVEAMATDRDNQFAVVTVPLGLEQPEAIFVLDFLTGRLTGGLINPQNGVFTNFYVANVAADFQIGSSTKPKFALVPGSAPMSLGGVGTVAQGLLYIAELNSGVVQAYSFPYRITQAPIPEPVLLKPIARFPFRNREGSGK